MAFVGPRATASPGPCRAGAGRSPLGSWPPWLAAGHSATTWAGSGVVSELVMTRAVWRPASLWRRPWVRVGLRLGAAAALLHVVGIAMPDAAVVGSLFVFAGVAGAVLVGVAGLAGLHVDCRAEWLAAAATGTAVGLSFELVGVATAGWSPVVALLLSATALGVAPGSSAKG